MRLLMDSHSRRIPIESEYFETAFTCMEILAFMYALRGLSNYALEIADLLIDMVRYSMSTNTNIGNSEDHALSLIPYSTRIDSIYSITLLACSKKVKDIHKALKLIESAEQKMKDYPVYSHNPHISYTMALAIREISNSQFYEAASKIQVAVDHAASDGNIELQYQALIAQSWCNFMTGNLSKASNGIDQILSFCASSTHKQLHIWALELDILMKSFVKDLDGINLNINLLCTLRNIENEEFRQKTTTTTTTSSSISSPSSHTATSTDGGGGGTSYASNGLSATTNAIIAYALVSNHQYLRAIPYGTHACLRLSEKIQVSPIGYIQLYCAIYAMMSIIEYSHTTSTSTSTSATSRNAQKSKFTRSTLRRTLSDWNSTSNHKKLLDLVRNSMKCVSENVKRFPCLLPLSLSLILRLERITTKNKNVLRDIDIKISEIHLSSSLPSQFVFATAFLHLERVLFYHKVGITTDDCQAVEYDTSCQLSSLSFMKLGGCPDALREIIVITTSSSTTITTNTTTTTTTATLPTQTPLSPEVIINDGNGNNYAYTDDDDNHIEDIVSPISISPDVSTSHHIHSHHGSSRRRSSGLGLGLGLFSSPDTSTTPIGTSYTTTREPTRRSSTIYPQSNIDDDLPIEKHLQHQQHRRSLTFSPEMNIDTSVGTIVGINSSTEEKSERHSSNNCYNTTTTTTATRPLEMEMNMEAENCYYDYEIKSPSSDAKTLS
eukprot:gene2156-4197_t